MITQRLLTRPLTVNRPLLRRAYTTKAPSAINQSIKSDHQALRDAYRHYEDNKNEKKEAQMWANKYIHDLARHSVAEEIILYPAFKTMLGKRGQEMAERDYEHQQVIKEIAFQLQSMKAGEDGFDMKFKELVSIVELHMKEEEEIDLPALDKGTTEADGHQLAEQFEKMKSFVPTRSHPSAPQNPVLQAAAGLVVTPFDKLMDQFRTFPSNQEKKVDE
ncbi:HHE domain-containing protein [Planoprotostelium fungivorum]|uniref:HHE domain-containing protein n=1 Tax=Planoprotostelium fungivorum TaxID=1890364 RepID=A0A2P6NNI0_9EUKA|nr:HHE domain-containing protein [Planoprotostelium fungivorum]